MQIMTKYRYIKMHALKEMWKPIFADQEIEVMKMIPAEKFNKLCGVTPFLLWNL